jgi:hypothetical protein
MMRTLLSYLLVSVCGGRKGSPAKVAWPWRRKPIFPTSSNHIPSLLSCPPSGARPAHCNRMEDVAVSHVNPLGSDRNPSERTEDALPSKRQAAAAPRLTIFQLQRVVSLGLPVVSYSMLEDLPAKLLNSRVLVSVGLQLSS